MISPDTFSKVHSTALLARTYEDVENIVEMISADIEKLAETLRSNSRAANNDGQYRFVYTAFTGSNFSHQIKDWDAAIKELREGKFDIYVKKDEDDSGCSPDRFVVTLYAKPIR